MSNDLRLWQRGDELTAERLNEMVEYSNQLSHSIHRDIGGEGSSQGSSSGGNNGRFQREIHRMHTENGVGKIVDGWVANSTEMEIEGNYARTNGVFYHNVIVEGSCGNCLKKIGEICPETILYQKITTDNKGVPTKVEMVQFGSTESCQHTNSYWRYDVSCSSSACGVIYNRMSKTVVDCRISCSNPKKHQRYTTIKYNDFYLPPMPHNTRGYGVELLKEIDGNTIPVKALNGFGGSETVDCDDFIEIHSGIAFVAESPS